MWGVKGNILVVCMRTVHHVYLSLSLPGIITVLHLRK